MLLDKPLQSSRLVLRNLQAEDATSAYLGWLLDPEVNAYLEVRFSPPSETSELRSFILDANASSHSLLLGIFTDEGKQHIGNIKLGPIDAKHGVGDIGIVIGEKASWGKGYASEAIGCLTAYGFEVLGLAKITAGCYAVNEGSTRAFLNVGYQIEGRRLQQWQAGDGRVDGVLLGCVNPKFSIIPVGQ